MTFSIFGARTDMWKEFGASMGAQTTRKSALLIFITLPAFAGCSSHGAPSFVLFGAFFPAWMLCAFIGIFGAIAARGIFVAAGLDSFLPFQLFVCSSVGFVVAALTWLFWFGQSAGKPHRSSRGKVISIAIIAIAVAVAIYVEHWISIHPSTDDPTIDADVVHVAAAVGGRIIELPV